MPNINDLNEKVRILKNKYYARVPTSKVLDKGIFETGSFPINAATDNPILPSNIENIDKQNVFTKFM